MSLYNMYENIPEASILEMFETEIESDESEEPAIFALDEEYLKKIVELYTEDTSETDSISTDDNDDLISELCSEDIIIEQKESKILTCCVIVNKIDGCIKRCENSKSFRTLWQLCGVWQIDGESIIEADGILEQLGICSYHFNHDQKNLHNPGFKKTKNTGQSILHRKRCLFCGKLFYFFTRGLGCEKHSWNIIGKNIQVVCNGQVNCSALESYDSVCKRHNEVKSPRYVCCNCYEREEGHLHIKPGRGRAMLSCIEKGYHREDIKKSFHLLTQWFLNVAKNENFEYQKNILTAILPQIIPFFNLPQPTTNTSQHINCNHNIPSYFVLKTIMKINKIPIDFQEKESDEKEYEEIGQKMGQELWKSSKHLKKNKNNLQNPESLSSYIGAFPRPLITFFESMLMSILENKTAESNRKQHSPLKKMDLQKVNTLLSLLVSSLVNFAFPYSNLWLPSVLASLC
ncbi:uncharacterized protein OCT59_010698 [Rhizophagus irregularis]|uniref:Uncharacterized protein n=2 Tax=Rhizophagus irregularis TaxID=588596 RepID=A0A2P4QYE4_RHIID|nr:hypothetical protein GLOIN_2v1867373 [Rhizophagus irregularis DAOM 181602=DAOM 197198]POG82657.1 hypothetical protein GLOIN_2v1867373 [Rhizophagus irregularis DAOM 181602=DAOM 197198]UZO19402.1 hypothetical protein OCT59_010698 [Rhizophagus irregularis]GET52211.1 hypothetical protein GLOIN_2v1867373 [Rhizophagus irregularis DAOM 181602=DAOM 197198]|eukprot:XP_025189523.1 hypothetical protein GLOIN_2v1867373 [Rhizophagus irregularis DAOM 181602=DAOM 197198]